MEKPAPYHLFKPSVLCFVDECRNKSMPRPGLSFYGFPKDPSRCQEWLENMGRPYLFPTAMKKDRWKICEDHFSPSQFMDPNLKGTTKMFKRLIHCAVPTLFDHLSGQKVVTPVKKLASQRKFNSSHSSFIEKYKNDCKYQPEVRLHRLPKGPRSWVTNAAKPDLFPEVMTKDKPSVCGDPFLPSQMMDPHLRGTTKPFEEKPILRHGGKVAFPCLVANCKNAYGSRPGITLFRFPIKDPIRCQKWAKNAGRPDLFPTEIKRDRWRICEDHFSSSQFMDPTHKGTTKMFKRLIHCAVPTLFDQ